MFNSLVKHSLIYGVARLIAAVLGLVVLHTLTNLLDPNEFGTYALVFSGATLSSSIFFTWIMVGMVRFYTEAERIPVVTTAYIVFCAVLVMVVTAVSFLTNTFPYFYLHKELALEGLVLFAAIGWFEFQLEICRCSHESMRYGIFRCLNQMVTLTAIFFLVETQPFHEYALAAMILGSGLAGFVLGASHFRYLNYAYYSRKILRDLFRYGIPFSFTVGLGIFLDYSDRFFIYRLMDDASLGLYSAQYTLVQTTLNVILSVVYLGGVPMILRDSSTKSVATLQQQLQGYWGLFLAVSLPAAVGMMMLYQPINAWLLGADYQITAWLLPFIVVNLLLNGLRSFYVDLVFQIQRKPIPAVLIILFIMASDVILNYLLIPHFGMLGAIMASFISITLGSTMSLILVRRLFPLPLWSEELSKVLLATMSMAVGLAVLILVVNFQNLPILVLLGGLIYVTVLYLSNFHRLRSLT